MLIFLPLALFFITPLLISILFRRWQRLAMYWFVLIGVTFLSWVAFMLARSQLPQSLSILPRSTGVFSLSIPTLVIDQISLPYAIALITFFLSLLLTDVIRTYITEPGDQSRFQVTWSTWAMGMIYTGLGLVAVLAQNLPTLVLTWAALDVVELIIRVVRSIDDKETESAVLIISIRALGISFALLGMLNMTSLGSPGNLANLSAAASFWLFLAVGVRLGILPFHISLPRPRVSPYNLESVLLYVPAAASLVFLGRLATTTVLSSASLILLLLVLVAGMLGGVYWNLKKDLLGSHPAWIAGVASLAFISAIFLQPTASLSWGLTLLLYGGLLAFYTAHHKILNYILGISLIGLTALPYTAAWGGILVYYPAVGSALPRPVSILALLLILLIQTGLLVGAVRRMLTAQPKIPGLERWIWWIYGLGLIFLPLVSLILAWWAGLWSAITQSSLTIVQTTIPGFAVIVLTLTALFLRWRGVHTPRWIADSTERLLKPRWLLRLLLGMYRLGSRAIHTTDRVLEGAGGILWTLLLITLLVSLIAQITRGAGP